MTRLFYQALIQAQKALVSLRMASSKYQSPNVPTERATFSMACFWGPDALFGCTPGVIRTKVGYTGGTSVKPTYRNLADHTETVQIDYNPKEISYDKLLNIFWHNHDPTAENTRQYMSAIFYHDANQQTLAMSTKKEIEKEIESDVLTEISPAKIFYDAEEYHQKYILKQHPWLLNSLNIDPDEITDSYICARLNGYVAGYGDMKIFEVEWPKLGLSKEQADFVIKAASQGVKGSCGT